ncbi:MAG: hypothetical protein KGJ09_02235 [Candidatus Omnitrophica bacterium]|nr:hypothetical protein [Candidatus Omnitrophota bacterium]MDE2008877.1 hypothetical protein [Candidatus Omnitrophota bacterium]MDE2213560.1 hypothetical protein [Candidatus Omnitrophota bacterium]MDE2230539.1 hypothetical protein [Candidatus Omnitrophota bacterium]
MTGLAAVLIPSLMGYFVLRCFRPWSADFSLTDIFLSVGLGAGLSVQIIFYSLLVLNHIAPTRIIQAHVLCLAGLFFCLYRYRPKQPVSFSCRLGQAAGLSAVLMLTALMAVIFALVRPWGDWDGWAYWNFHAKFLFDAGYGWRRIFEHGVQAHHPWLLPLLDIWGWSFYGAVKEAVPLAIGIIFTVSTVGLLVASLKKYVPFAWALLAGFFLVSIPGFIQHGTSQYADIEAAFFILMSSVVAVDLLESPRGHTAVLTGLCLGLTACTKDNGIVAALLLLILIIVRLSKSGSVALIRPLGWGFTATGLAVALMRCFETYNPFSDSYAVFLPGLWNWHKWVFMARFAFHDLFGFHWGGLWILALAVLMACRGPWAMGKAAFLMPFMVSYAVFYFFIFALSALNIQWLLSVAFDRTLYLLVPTLVFALFYAMAEGRADHYDRQ